MDWTPPTENEFNDKWVKPLEALDVSDIELAEDHEVWALVERLRAGQLIAVARTGSMRADLAGVTPFVRVNAGAWRRMKQTDEHYFWRTGDLSVEPPASRNLTGPGQRDRFFDIRFDPESFTGRPHPTQFPNEENEAPPNTPGQRRGAKRKDWWDQLWIEMIRRMEAGTLNPSGAKELQEILEDHVEHALGGKFGDSTLKPMARNLFKYLEERRGKIPDE